MKPKIVELNQNTHSQLKVARGCAVKQAATQHLIGLKVNELVRALAEFPVFFTRPEKASDEGIERWSLSAMMSITAGQNLYVVDDAWDAVYLPSAMRTYPLFLMQSSNGKKSYSVGIDPTSKAFADDGEPLFDEEAKPTPLLNQMTAQLDADINNEILTYKFVQQLLELELIQEIKLSIIFADNTKHTLRGLHTINEVKFHELSDESTLALKRKGFLAPIYAMLFSTYQLNALIKRHNLQSGANQVLEIKVITDLEEQSEGEGEREGAQ